MNNPKDEAIFKLLKSKNLVRNGSQKLAEFSNSRSRKTFGDQKTESESKGFLFEEFTAKLFSTKRFTLLEWRGDKCLDGVFPLSSQFPDLEFCYRSESELRHFAIECKWREHFQNDCVKWAKKGQLDTYRRFEEISNIPVFVILGIGGRPNNPNAVYVIPLKDIEENILQKFTIEIYLRKSAKAPFFLNCSMMLLK